MSPTDAPRFAVEIHPPDWRFPAGKTWVGGWIHAGKDRFITDLRAWIDGRPFLALAGLPKPGWDEHLQGHAGPPYSGFVVQVEPHHGARLLRLETRDPAGRWTEFFRQKLTVSDDAPVRPVPGPLAARLPELLPALLRLRAQRLASPWSQLADELVSATLAIPLHSLPVPPFFGALEEPRDTGWLRFGRLSVKGWLAHRSAKIVRVTALVDAIQESVLLHGLPREDISGVFTDLPGSELSHFVGHVDLPAGQSSPALVKVFAELDNGEKHLAFARRFAPKVIAGAEAALPPLSRTLFARATWALRQSASRHGVPIGRARDLVAGSKAAWSQLLLEAPVRTQRRIRPVAVRPVPAPPATGGQRRRILVATHNLNFEGAPWFIFELARYLHGQPGTRVRVVSPHDGPMGQVFADAGMPVEILDLSATLQSASARDFPANLEAATAGLPWSETDLVIGNTMVSFWAVHAARRAGKPAILYVHESSPVRRFFAPLVPAALFPVIEEAFRAATQVVFTAEASRAVYAHLGDRGNFALLPSWVDLGRVDAFAATHDPASLRRKHGLAPDATLVVNIGTVCERKGQHVFIQAIRLLQNELPALHPGRNIQFVMVGARANPYLQSLEQEVRALGLSRTIFVPETSEIFDFYRLADIFVCTSFEESFPRVLLESAAFQLPIISTNVNGIPEMLAPDEAWLVPPGDRHALAAALKLALAAHFAGDRRRPDKARAAVLRKYADRQSLPQHAALAWRAAQG